MSGGLDGLPVIAGAGLAGIMAALEMERPCVLLSPKALGTEAASALAQGGMAAAIGPGDSPACHARDTMSAGDGLCDPRTVEAITAQGPGAVEALLAMGVPFDRASGEELDLHLEAAHSEARIVHARGDGSGAAIMNVLAARVRVASQIIVLEGAFLERIMVDDGAVCGVVIRHEGHRKAIRTGVCVIASGGVGALYGRTTSPASVRGGGLAIAARAGARLRDMEFVQYHPTALAVDGPGRAFLVSEAVRGQGGRLIDETGARFTNELAPRDRVARAIAAHLGEGHQVFLDTRQTIGSAFADRFPAIAQACLQADIDPLKMPIPVRPAVHYHMGGIATDLRGRTTLSGLWACGEVACTGLHGANRLASNSLLEAFVMGRAVGHDLHGRGLPGPVRLPDLSIHGSVSQQGDYRSVLEEAAGILRAETQLEAGLRVLLPRARQDDEALVGTMICHAALKRRESRGAHCRTDFPERGPISRSYEFTLTEAFPEHFGVETQHD